MLNQYSNFWFDDKNSSLVDDFLGIDEKKKGKDLIALAGYRRAISNFVSIVTGKSSSPLDNLLVQAGQLSEKPLGENFMSWDRPLHFFANVSYNHPKNWGVSARIEFESKDNGPI